MGLVDKCICIAYICMYILDMLIYLKGRDMCLCLSIQQKKKKNIKIVKKYLSHMGTWVEFYRI